MSKVRKISSAAAVVVGLAVVLLLVCLPGLYVVPVLMYHSINYAKTERASANTVSPESFQKQLNFIRQGGYKVLSLDEYYEGLKAGKNFCCKSVVITFDDGLADNYSSAFPVLKQFGFPATFFVPTDTVGKSGGMTWDQVKEVSGANITVGSHLIIESYLPDMLREQQEEAIKGSKKILEAQLGRSVNYLAYPTGGFNNDVKRITRDAGYKLAFTTNRGYDRFNHDLYALRRIRPKDSDNPLILWMKLSGYYNLVRQSKNPY